MEVKDILEYKINKSSLYSLFLSTASLFMLSISLVIVQIIDLFSLKVAVLEAILYFAIIVSAIFLGIGIVYNGFLGSVKTAPIFSKGRLSDIARFFLEKKYYLLTIALFSIALFTFAPRDGFLNETGLVIFSLIVILISFILSVGYGQLLRSGYLNKRHLAEIIVDLQEETKNISVAADIEANKTFQEITKEEKSKKKTLRKKEHLNEILKEEIARPNISRPLISVLILNKINKELAPPERIEDAFVFWQDRFLK